MVYHGGVGEDSERGYNAGNNRDISAPSGWVTTQQAARALDISPRTVRWHIGQGNLEAKPEGEGVKRTWLVSIDSLQEFRDRRQHEQISSGDYRTLADDAEIAADVPGNAIRVLADRLVEESARASEFRVRLEVTERAQSTLEEELTEERQRRQEAERERDELRRRLEATSETPPERPETASRGSTGEGEEQAAREETYSGEEEADERRHRGVPAGAQDESHPSSLLMGRGPWPWRYIALAFVVALLVTLGVWLGYVLVSSAL